MKILSDKISSNTFGVASQNLQRSMPLIESKMGIPNLKPGTLNISIAEDYIVILDDILSPEESGLPETIKLQRCLISGYKAIIMRPNTHEQKPNYGHGKAHLELMSAYHLKTTLNLTEGSTVKVEVEGDDGWWNSGK